MSDQTKLCCESCMNGFPCDLFPPSQMEGNEEFVEGCGICPPCLNKRPTQCLNEGFYLSEGEEEWEDEDITEKEEEGEEGEEGEEENLMEFNCGCSGCLKGGQCLNEAFILENEGEDNQQLLDFI